MLAGGFVTYRRRWDLRARHGPIKPVELISPDARQPSLFVLG
jgi:hypothetical protein